MASNVPVWVKVEEGGGEGVEEGEGWRVWMSEEHVTEASPPLLADDTNHVPPYLRQGK